MLLRTAAAAGPDALAEVAKELVRAQPAMAGLRTAAALAVGAPDPAAAIDAFAARVERAPGQIARHTLELLALRTRSGPLRIATCSKSRPVEEAIRLAAKEHDVLVSCAEGRPRKEGQSLARVLGEAGIAVDLSTDAGLASVVPGADALLVGADAICTSSFINKVGTSALCALAAATGVPTYVLAGREKVLPVDVFGSITLRSGSPQEVSRDPGLGVQPRNPYFEVIPLALCATVVTDAGALLGGDLSGISLWNNMSV